MTIQQIGRPAGLEPQDSLSLPRENGTYALLLRLPADRDIRVGQLGPSRFTAGHYLYVGSALGSGGLAARLRRHLTAVKPSFWHIDYLRQAGMVTAVYYQTGAARRECVWATAVAQLPGATIPLPRFGASDCRCAAHLVQLTAQLANAALITTLSLTASAGNDA